MYESLTRARHYCNYNFSSLSVQGQIGCNSEKTLCISFFLFHCSFFSLILLSFCLFSLFLSNFLFFFLLFLLGFLFLFHSFSRLFVCLTPQHFFDSQLLLTLKSFCICLSVFLSFCLSIFLFCFTEDWLQFKDNWL